MLQMIKMLRMTKLTEIMNWLLRLLDMPSIYQTRRQSERKKYRERQASEKRRVALGVRKFFEQNYELRYNVMKQT